MAGDITRTEAVAMIVLPYLLLCLFISIGAGSNMEALISSLQVGIVFLLVTIIVYSYYYLKKRNKE
jgi:hypothetical protein